MADWSIKVENLSKLYRIGLKEQRHETFVGAGLDFLRSPLRNFKQLRGLTNFTKSDADSNDVIWALRDVSFEVVEGEVLGIIGTNGAGKSTLLKILAGITEPTNGRALVKGRVASLLEIGTGFHPDLTGRENIFLNGTILGMTKVEVDRKFDEIIAFSGVEKFIDTPVKRYSSGMRVRLAFAVAAHLEPEILLIDEVLAVGDAQFQRKCLGKIGEVAQGGRTVLFVSHNLTAVLNLSRRVLLLDSGRTERCGTAGEVVETYISSFDEEVTEKTWDDSRVAPGSDQVKIRALRVFSESSSHSPFSIGEKITLEVEYDVVRDATSLFVIFRVKGPDGAYVFETPNSTEASSNPDEFYLQPLPSGRFVTRCMLPRDFLNDIRYSVSVVLASPPPPHVLAEAKDAVSFSGFDPGSMRAPGLEGKWLGCVRARFEWESVRIGSSNHENKQVIGDSQRVE